MKKTTYIGIDLGGTKIHGVCLSSSNTVIRELKVLTEAHKGKKSILKKMFQMVDVLRDSDTKAIGIGLAGPLDNKKGILHRGPNLPGWKNVKVKEIFEKECGLPCSIENDAKCFTLAEYKMGRGKGSKNMVGITLGTGIGGAIIIDGELYRGNDNIAGEFGHTTIDYKGHKCSCGNDGCLERYASGTAIVERCLRHIRKGDKKTVLKEKDLTARKVYAAALEKDPLATHIMEDTGKYFGIGLANIVNILNPDIIVLGGSASKAYKVFKKSMCKELKRRAFAPANEVAIKRQTLSAPGAIGAALVAQANI